MPNTTQNTRHNDENDAIRYARPEGMPAEEWRRVKATAVEHIEALIATIRAERDDVENRP